MPADSVIIPSSTEMTSLFAPLAASEQVHESSSPSIPASLHASLHSSLPLPLPPLPASSHLSSPSTTQRLPSKASDLLFGGNKSHTTRPASTSLPGSKRSSAIHHTATTCHSPTPPTRGKEYDVLGESRLLIETFRDASKAMQRLGVLDGTGVSGGRSRGRHQHSRSLDGSQIVTPNAGSGVGGVSGSGAGRSGLVRKVRTLWRSPSPSPTSPTHHNQQLQHIQPTRHTAAAAAQSSTAASTTAHSSSAPAPVSPLPTSSTHPLSPKVRSLLLGPKPANKLHDRLGMTVAMMDLFSSQPKAFQRLGLFSTTQSEERRNVNGVVVSGMRQLMSGWLWVVEGRGVMRRVRRRYWVLTLDALTWYESEDEMMAGGEVNLMHGAVVRRDKDWVLEPPVMGVVRSRRRREEDGPLGGEEKEEKQADEAGVGDGQRVQQRVAGEEEREGIDWGPLAEEEEKTLATPHVSSPTTTAPSSSTPPTARARVLYGFSVTPLRSISGDTRTYHLLAPTTASLQAWTKSIITTLRKANSRSGVIVHDASRSSDMPGNLTYLHSRTKEGWLFRLSSTLAPLTHSSSSQWLPRYCILSNTSLSIFLSADHTTPAARAQGKLPLYTLSLRECSVIAVEEEVGGGQGWVFELRGHRVHNMGEHHKHVFGCVSAEERRDWMRLLDFAGNGGRRRHVSWTEAKLSEVDSKVGDGAGVVGVRGAVGGVSEVSGGGRMDVMTLSSVGVSLSAVAVMDESKADEVEDVVSRADGETVGSAANSLSAAGRARSLLPSPHSHSLSAHGDAEHKSADVAATATSAVEEADQTQVIDL